MGDLHDYVALEWVKGEIAETLKQARHALEAYVENPQDTSRLRFCLTHVHQVQGTLQMVEFFGAALLAEEVEHLVLALLEGRVSNQNEAMEVLMQGILQLPNYLDRVQEARRDLPMVVLPLLNDLRAAHGGSLLSETSLFSPDLSARPTALNTDALARLAGDDLQALLRKLRQMLQVALVGIIRNQDLPTNLGYMARVFSRLEMLSGEGPQSPLWKIASGVVEGMAAGSIVNSTSVRMLLRQLDRELRHLQESGIEGLNRPAPEDLVKNLLFYIAKADSNTPRISTLKIYYCLHEALPDSGLVDMERARLAGPDKDAMRSVVAALCEELVQVKDSLDLFVRGDRLQVAELEKLLPALKQISDTLAVLGFGQPRKVIVDQLDVLSEMASGRSQVSDAALMDVAGALLYVEATLTGMAGPAADDPRSEQELMPSTDVAQVHQLVIKQARTGLEQSKDAIVEFIASQWNHDHLQHVPELLTQVRGGLAMIPLPRAAALIGAATNYIREQLLDKRVLPDWQCLDTLADAITSVEYYLERLVEDRIDQGDSILDLAEQSMASLGYPIQSVELPVESQAYDSHAETVDTAEMPALGEEVIDEDHPQPVPESSVEDQQVPVLEIEEIKPDSAEGIWQLNDSPKQEFEVIEYQSLPAEEPSPAQLPVDKDIPLADVASLEGRTGQSNDWDESELAALDIVPVELPELAADAAADSAEEAKTLSMAEVMAASEPAINPPATEMPPSILPPPPDEERVDEELVEIFVEEAGEVLETIGVFLPQWLAALDDKQALSELRRAFHTLKGSGRMVRALVIGELSWSVENMLNRVIDRSIVADQPLQDLISAVVDLLPDLIQEYADNTQRQRDDVDRLAAAAHCLALGIKPDPVIQTEHHQELADTGHVAADEAPEQLLDPQLMDIFRNEAQAHLETLDAFLADCARELPQPVTDDLQRALHTLKGSAYMAGVLPIAAISAPLEKLAKEFKVHLLDIDLAVAELLRDAQSLIQRGVDQLESSPLAPIAGTAELLERIEQLHQARIAASQAERLDQAGESGDPQLSNIFLAQGMDILLDAEVMLDRWRNDPAELHKLDELLEALAALSKGAAVAELPQIDELCKALLEVYRAAAEGSLLINGEFFDEVERAHEALISMMDQVAAGLQVEPHPQRCDALRALPEFIQAVPEEVPTFDSGEPELAVTAVESGNELAAEPEAKAEIPSEPEVVELPADQAIQTGSIEPVAEAAALTASADFDQEMVEIFLEEALDLLESAGQEFDRWQADPQDRSALLALQRDLHTLKGGARMAEIRQVGDLAHELETLYEGFGDGRFSPSPELFGLLQQGHDLLSVLIEQLQSGNLMGSPAELIAALINWRNPGASGQQSSPVAESQPGNEEPSQTDFPAPEAKSADQPDASLPDTTASYPQWSDEDAELELVEIFLEEGFDILESAAQSLHNWTKDTNNSLELQALQRDLHTLKGGARMADIAVIGDLAHELEFLYEGLAEGRFSASSDLVSLLHQSHDCLAEMLESLRDGRLLPQGDKLIAAIKAHCIDPGQQLDIPDSVILQEVSSSTSGGVEADILDIFLEEADELIESLRDAINRWASSGDAAEANQVLRVLHTLKGGAQLAGQKHLGDATQQLDDFVSGVLLQGEPWPDRLFSEIQTAFEALQSDLELLRQRVSAALEDNSREEAAEPPRAVKLEQPIVAVSLHTTATRQEAKVLPFVRRAAEAAQEAAARRAPQELIKVPAELLEGLVNLAGETSIFRGRVEQQVSDVTFTLSEMEATIERVRDQLRRLDTETQAQILSRYQAEAERSGYEDFDPLEMDRHSQLQQLSRALFESASDLLDLKETLATRNRDAETLLLQQARVNTELQEGLMRTRMVPFDRLVPRLRRIVRQVSGELGKQVEFEIGNAEGEMDRSVLERIVAPLEHMLRNAVDHGIEPVAVRRSAGKPEVGSIRLGLGREGGDILLTLSDDGAGINLSAVRRKAIERGLMDPESDLSDHEILQFILESGFSTAEKVTQISGRGVGMDVAHSEVKQLGGSMTIESAYGQGTRFLIRLPFTVSVNRALMVYSGEDLYAIPLNSIEGIVRVSPFELESIYEKAAAATSAAEIPRFEYAGQAYELKYLGDLLDNGQHPKLIGQSLPLPVILVRSSDHVVAVQVDSLAGSREIVVKSIGRQFAGVHGISGATILGDGRVVVILDLLASIRAKHARMLSSLPRSVLRPQLVPDLVKDRPPLVMVVDDSVTVRKVTTRLLERAGMNVLTAKDGVDAITLLQEQVPDIMLLDVEMPRMDGFEVASLVRHDERLKDLPIIMITSRTGDKHRQRALAIGVNEYLGKPYQESTLLETINNLVRRHD